MEAERRSEILFRRDAQQPDARSAKPPRPDFGHGLGPKVGEAMVVHPAVKAVSFTGSTTVGKRTDGIAAPMREKVRSEEHTSELQFIKRLSYEVLCLIKKKKA